MRRGSPLEHGSPKLVRPYHHTMTTGQRAKDIFSATFFGPWVPVPGQDGPAAKRDRTRHHYLSLAHWYESFKFMPAHPDLRDAVLMCPTIKEARKFSRSHQSQWRSDWNMVRQNVLILGLCFLTLDRPDLELPTWDRADLLDQLGDMQIPLRFLQFCMPKYEEWLTGPAIGTYGAQDAPDRIVGKKLASVVSNKPSWTLVTLCNSKTAWRVHDWALSLYIPVRYIGTPKSRLTSSLAEQLVQAVDQMIVFEHRGGRRADGMIQRLRAEKKTVTLELYSAKDMQQSILA